ncbi:NTP transferase domain-containing protein [Parasphingorhabdus sp.]|uniref:NTP transferase domain-containing protein n=1 Tax=Parasphingorhabdus sp. TaxID=2709688 RepID=UPI003A9228FA
MSVLAANDPALPVGGAPTDAKPLWTAIILAGQRPEGDPMAVHCDVPHKALIEIAGQSMLERVTRALMASSDVGKIVIMTQSPETLKTGFAADLLESDKISFIVSNDGIAASIHEVAGSAVAPWPVLVTTADNALLTTAILDGFFLGYTGQDVAVGVVERKTMLAAYPDAKRTWLKFRGGAYSGANLFALHNAAAKPALALWATVEQDRKKGWKLLFPFGPWLLLRAITRTISFKNAMGAAGQRLLLRAEPIILPFAEAAIDVDKQSDLELVTSILEKRYG